jgi:hypothetical protein
VHRSVPAVLLSLVYAAALALALTDVGSHALAGAVVLAGLTTRWALRHRHRRTGTVTALAPATNPAAVLPTDALSPAAAA